MDMEQLTWLVANATDAERSRLRVALSIDGTSGMVKSEAEALSKRTGHSVERCEKALLNCEMRPLLAEHSLDQGWF